MAAATAAVPAYVAVAPLSVNKWESDRQGQLTIERLLTAANLQVEAEQVFKPKNDNAYQTYREALGIQPDNPAR